MPIFLVNGFLLFGLVALVPVFLHLLHRRRPQPVPFAAVRFLKEAISKSRRSRRVTQCLTLLMRVLIILLLAAAFAQPQIRFSRFVPGGHRTVLLVLDTSASMHASEGGKTLFERSRAWAENVLAGLAEALFTPPAIIGNGAFQATATVRTNDHFVGTNIVRLETESGELNHVALDLLPGESRGAGLAAAAPGEAPQLSGCLRLENDAYELNNSFFYSLPRLAGLPALLVNGTGERDTFFLRRALQPGGQAAALMVPTVVSWPEFLAGDISGNAAVMLCNPPVLDDTAVAKLRQYLINGGAVALFPGENDGIQATALQQFPGWKDLALATRENPELARMDVSLLDSHEPLGQRLGAMLPPPWSIPVRRFLLAQPPDRSGVLLHFQQNNGAFIQRCRVEAGALWLCAVSANRDWSDWPMTPFFLVFVQELAREIAGMRLRGLSTVVHTPLPLAWPGAATRVILTITDPLGHERQVNGTRDSGADPLLVDGWQRPGLHTLTDGETTWQIAVNIPNAERDPAGLSSAELLASLAPLPAAYSSDHDQLRRQLTELRQGSPLWPLLLILAFVLSMLEVLFANSRSRAVAQPRLVGELLKQGGRVA